MPAKFLTLDEIPSQRDRARQIGAAHVERFYSELGTGFGKALFFYMSANLEIRAGDTCHKTEFKCVNSDREYY